MYLKDLRSKIFILWLNLEKDVLNLENEIVYGMNTDILLCLELSPRSTLQLHIIVPPLNFLI